MSEPPNNSELARLINALSEQVHGLVIEIRADRAIVDNTYVRKDVWDAQHKALIRDIKEVASDVEAHQKQQQEREKSWRALRNQMLGGLVILAVPSLLTAIIAINNLIAVRGGR